MNYVRNFLPSFDAQNNFISSPPLDRLGAHTSQEFSSPKCFIVLVLHSFGTKMAVLNVLEVWEQHQCKWCVLTCILRATRTEEKAHIGILGDVTFCAGLH